jgi:hypothetical protein
VRGEEERISAAERSVPRAGNVDAGNLCGLRGAPAAGPIAGFERGEVKREERRRFAPGEVQTSTMGNPHVMS